jgi:hypothetical protein
MVGFTGARGAGEIVLGADVDPAFQAEALGLMEPLVSTGEVPGEIYAALYDATHTPQRYGMIGGCKQLGKPLEDPEHVDERLATLGLPPMSSCYRWGNVVNGTPAPPTGK